MNEQKWKIKFDKDEDSYISYRIISKNEAQAHLDNYTDQKNILDTNIVTWQEVVDHEIAKETEELP